MSEEKFGIENLKKVVQLGAGVKKWYDDSNADGKIELSEYFGLLPQLMSVPELIQKKDAIVDEAKDLSFEEVQELIAGIEGATTENVVGIIEDSLNFIVAGKNLIERFTKKTL